MTEYDYSPAAYTQYMEKQRGVSSWVSEANQNSHRYVHPFQGYASTPTVASSASSYTARPSRHSSTRTRDIPRPSTSRSMSTPHPRDSERLMDRPRERPSRQRSSSHSHSSSRPLSPTSHPPLPHLSQHRQTQSPVTYAPVRSPNGGYSYRSSAGQFQASYTPGGQLIIPTPRRGEQYIVVPQGGKIEFAPSPHRSQSPRKTQQEPLLKRLFTFGSRSGSTNKGSSSGSTKSVKPREPRRHSTY